MRPDDGASPTGSYGPVLISENMSSAVMRPSFEKPTFMRPVMLGRARPMNISSSRDRRIITGALHFFESSAGMVSEIAPVILLPNPPPVYSLMKTTLSGSGWPLASSNPSQRAMAGLLDAKGQPDPDK